MCVGAYVCVLIFVKSFEVEVVHEVELPLIRIVFNVSFYPDLTSVGRMILLDESQN